MRCFKVSVFYAFSYLTLQQVWLLIAGRNISEYIHTSNKDVCKIYIENVQGQCQCSQLILDVLIQNSLINKMFTKDHEMPPNLSFKFRF